MQQALCLEAPSLPTSAPELGMAWLLPNSPLILETTAWLQTLSEKNKLVEWYRSVRVQR